MNHDHKFVYFEGRDGTPEAQGPFERYCKSCGIIEVYSSLADTWVKVGNMSETLPEETGERFLDPYGH